MSENIKIMDIIHDMEIILDEASGFPLSKKVGIDKEEFLDLLSELKDALPFELETAINIIKEQDAILEAARNDAKFLLDDAKRERDQKYKECNEEIIIKNKQVDSEIENMMKEATIRAEELVSENRITKDAKARSERMIKEATEYIIGKRTYNEMFAQLEIAIHQFAKRQMTWFRGMERRGFTIHWIKAEWERERQIEKIIELRGEG